MENRVIATTEYTPIEVALKMDQDGFVRCKSLYEFLELSSAHYAKWCKTNIEENLYAERNVDYQVFTLKGENPQGGRPTTDYKLTASFAKKLAIQSKTERGEQARCYFIACEESLKKIALERKQWEIERAKGVMIRHILTDTIKMKIADSPHKRFAYPNYTKLIYKMVFGTDLKTLQEKYGVKAKESVREYLTVEQLREIESIEMLVSSLINIGMGYNEIKAFLELRYKSALILTA